MKKCTLLGLKILLLLIFVIFCNYSTHAQWQQTGGPEGGIISSFATLNGNIFVGTKCGIYMSSDTGLSWKAVNNGLTYTFINALAISGNTVFAATEQGVFVTNDYGVSWHSSNSGLMDKYGVPHIMGLLVVGDTIFAAADNGIDVSGNGGATWQLRDSTSFTSGTISCLAQEGGIYLASVWNMGIFISYDACRTWTQVNAVSGDVVAINQGRIFASGDYYYTYASDDSGKTWVNLATLPKRMNAFMESFLVVGADIIAGSDFGIYRSNDNGYTWQQIVTNLENPLNYPYSFVEALGILGNRLFAGTGELNEYGDITGGQGVYSSPDTGITWNTSDSGIRSNTINCMVATDTVLYAGTDGEGFYLSRNNGKTWEAMNNGIADFRVGCIVAEEGYLYAGTPNGLFVSSDGAKSWKENEAIPSGAIGALAMGRTKILVGTLDGIFASDNHGASWSPSNYGLSSSDFSAILSIKGDTFMVSSDKNYISYNGGVSWDSITLGLIGTLLSATLINDTIFALTSHSVYYSSNFGKSWMGRSIPSADCYSMISRNDTLYTHSFPGFYLSADKAITWQEVSAVGLADSNIWCLASNKDYIFAGTYSSSIWSFIPTKNISTKVSESQMEYDIFTIFPNPTSNFFTIQSSNNSKQLLQVFDITGKLMFTQNIYNNKTSINASSLASGIYSVRLISNDGVGNEKLVIVK